MKKILLLILLLLKNTNYTFFKNITNKMANFAKNTKYRVFNKEKINIQNPPKNKKYNFFKKNKFKIFSLGIIASPLVGYTISLEKNKELLKDQSKRAFIRGLIKGFLQGHITRNKKKLEDLIDNIIMNKELSKKILDSIIQLLILNPDNLLLIEEINKTENKEDLLFNSREYLTNMFNDYIPYITKEMSSLSNDSKTNSLSEEKINIYINDQTLAFKNYIFPFILSDLLNKDLSNEKKIKIRELNEKFYNDINELVNQRQDVINYEIDNKKFFKNSNDPKLEKEYINNFLRKFLIKEMIHFNSILKKNNIKDNIKEQEINNIIEISAKLSSELNQLKKYELPIKKYKSEMLNYILNGNSRVKKEDKGEDSKKINLDDEINKITHQFEQKKNDLIF